MPPKIILTVTNDLNFDQRMQRIGAALAAAGYAVELVGRELPHSPALTPQPFQQVRLKVPFLKGPLFYASYNIRLFFYLLFIKFDAVGAVDFDTLPAATLAAWLKRKKRVFDAHEYFTETPEVTHRKVVKAVWGGIGRFFLLFYRHAYTVGPVLADIFTKKYRIPFAVVRNTPVRSGTSPLTPGEKNLVILYQGALNEGRGIETALEMMPLLPHSTVLWLAGEGDLSAALRKKAADLGLGERVKFLGRVPPEALRDITRQAWLGLNLLENRGLSYYYSLANKFFDYVQQGVPCLNMNFPEYSHLQKQYEAAILIDTLDPQAIAAKITALLENPEEYRHLYQNCIRAAAEWHWEPDRQTLLALWHTVIPPDSSRD